MGRPPIVAATLGVHPRGKVDHQERRERLSVGLVEQPELREPCGERIVGARATGVPASRSRRIRSESAPSRSDVTFDTADEHLRDVDQGVAGHGERELAWEVSSADERASRSAVESRIMVSAPSHDWLLCCDR